MPIIYIIFLLNSYNAKYLFYSLFLRYNFITNSILPRHVFYILYPLPYNYLLFTLHFCNSIINYIYFLFIAIKQRLTSAM